MDLREMSAANETGQMTTISIEQASKYESQEVTLKGWLYNLRESGKLLFPIFRDGTGIIQGVCALKENPEAFESLKGLTQESSLIVTGKIRAEKRAPGGFELGVSKIQIVQKVSESTPFPIQLKEHGVDFLLDHRHLWMRTPRQAAILRIRAEKSKTRRHLTEFWMLEPEAAYVELDEVMTLAESLVSAIVQSVLKNKSRELETLKRDTTKLQKVNPPFPRISYEDAIKVLHKHGNPAKFGDDIGGD